MPDARASILRWGSYFSPRQRAQLWKKEFSFKPDNAQTLLAERFDSAEGSFLDKTLYTDLHTYLPGDLLVKSDRMAMAASIEPRSPFLDHKMIEWSARVPDHLKLRGSRAATERKGVRAPDATRAVGLMREHIEGTEHILAGLLPASR